jgi:hypothetical protein
MSNYVATASVKGPGMKEYIPTGIESKLSSSLKGSVMEGKAEKESTAKAVSAPGADVRNAAPAGASGLPELERDINEHKRINAQLRLAELGLTCRRL